MGKEVRSRMRRSLGVIVIAIAGLGIFGLMMEQTDAPRSAGQTSAHAAALDAANTAFSEGDFATVVELLSDVVSRNTRDGLTWYRYAYAKEQAHNETDIHAYHRAWNLLRGQAPESDEFARAKQRVMASIRDYAIEVRTDVFASVESIQFTNTLSGGFRDLRADSGTTFVVYTVVIENESSGTIGHLTAPVPTLYDFDGNSQREDVEARVYLAATLDGLATGSLNPGVRGRYFRVYRVSQDRLARGGWFLRFADRTELPVN